MIGALLAKRDYGGGGAWATVLTVQGVGALLGGLSLLPSVRAVR